MASKLSQIQARFQQKQMQEKEEKLLRLYESQQQRAFDRVNRGSAGSNTSPISSTTIQGGKVRQMFDERRQKAGIDRSYPLEPLRITKSNGCNGNNNVDATKTIVKTTTIKKSSMTQLKNGKPLVNKKEVVHSIYNNNDGDESYESHLITDNNIRRPILNRTYKRRDLEMMMREHSRNENIDDEEFPDVNIDELENPLPKPKLTNIQNISPVQDHVISRNPMKPKTIVRNNCIEKPISPPKKESKPAARKSVTTIVRNSPVKEDLPSTKTVTPPTPNQSPTKFSPGTMSSRPARKSVDSARVPSAARPSSKSASRGPSTTARDDLQTCKYCNRRFADDRLAVHEDICAKTAKKKRKIYDATKHRLEGTELEPYTRKQTKSTTQKQTKPTPSKKTDWRRKHEEFISAIRAAKMAQAHVAAGGKLSDLPPPPRSENPDYVECPHCGRRFNEAAAQRHIPKCSSYQFNKTKQTSRPGGRK